MGWEIKYLFSMTMHPIQDDCLQAYPFLTMPLRLSGLGSLSSRQLPAQDTSEKA